MTWQEIETAPQDGTKFLAFQLDDECQVFVCWYENQFSPNWAGWQTTWDNEPEPTHWMPMPQLPRADGTIPVTVKPLVWEELGESQYRATAPLFGNLRVERYGGSDWMAVWSVPGFSDTFVDGVFQSAESAKGAMQLEYDKRISACVEQPQQ